MLKANIISRAAISIGFSILANGCSVSDKAVYGNLQALDLRYAENKSDLLVASIGDESAVRFRVGDARVWWVLNRLSKEGEIYSFPHDDLRPSCQAVEKLKESAQLNDYFEKEAYSNCKR
ncbi:hypothetical protein [Xanthomonas sp. D-109]|uniref:hypothetical protein n=1 Tax=Xanthomonas sp. D-109 TaxID=2821274 RepID=UPI001ADB2ABF|nr:hypothetical protein [Xanthomonas sp. D-109]MBO9882528.1 hypothetical protein [Xanthomonas sp. D-109]